MALDLAELAAILHKIAHPADHDIHEQIDALVDDSSSSSGKGKSSKGDADDA